MAAVVFDSIQIFAHLQNPESGDFEITGLANVNWLLVGLVSGVAIVIAIMLGIITSKKAVKEK